MELYEIEALIENLWRKDKESWDQTRLIINWCQQSTKPVNMFEKMVFPWEKGVKQEDSTEDRERIWKEMKEMENLLNKK